MNMVEINRLTESSIGLVANLIRKSTSHFSATYDRDIPLVQGNPQRIEQVIINLLVNACQALSDQEQSITVSTSYHRQSERVGVRIQDEGVGIPSDLLQRIKDPFFTTKRDAGSTGMGLAISERIVQDHGGTMAFASEPGQGTTVTVSFPTAVSS
jgi:polar amino acid transport system substrate-binding protein